MADLYPVDPQFAAKARIDKAAYQQQYRESVENPDAFWGKAAERLDWFTKPTKVKNVSYQLDDFRIKWFEDGELNVSVNCLDRQLATRGDKTALLFEPDSPDAPAQHVTYRELHERVCKLGNALRNLGVVKGDRVTIYLPMIVDAAVAMLACARIGAIHSVVFGGFAANSIADRVGDCASKLIITADEGLRGGKKVPLKANVDAALKLPGTNTVETVLVVRHTGGAVDMQAPRDRWFHDVVDGQPAQCEPERMNAEDPLFILYTSGSTGKPKGVLHTTAGYLLFAAYTHEAVFDLREDDIYWCTADVGWVTGHSYIVYGPLANGATTVMFEGVPNYPERVALLGSDRQAQGHHLLHRAHRDPRADARGRGAGQAHFAQEPAPAGLRRRADQPGGMALVLRERRRLALPGGRYLVADRDRRHPDLAAARRHRPQARLGDAAVLRRAAGAGRRRRRDPGRRDRRQPLILRDSWPGQMRTVYGDHQRFIDTYFRTYPGSYFTGDGCRRDEDGYYWITGRVDDVINVSGHRMGTAEVESALVLHPKVAEAAVVGFPHDIKGQGIYAYVTLVAEETPSDELQKELVAWVRKDIGPIATPDQMQLAPGLPKTRSGKIMRRILRKIAENAPDQLGDTSTLADPSVVASLVDERKVR